MLKLNELEMISPAYTKHVRVPFYRASEWLLVLISVEVVKACSRYDHATPKQTYENDLGES